MNYTLLLLLCFAFLGNVAAQNFAYNFPGDFDNAPSTMVKKPNGHFLIAGTTGGPIRSIPYRSASKGYILDWDAETGLSSSQQSEIDGGTTLHYMLVLANGNIIVSGWDNFCSELNVTLIYVKCFDPAGNLLWTTYTDTIPQSSNLADINTIQLAVRPGDGKVAQLFNSGNTGTVNLLDPNTGNVLFRSLLMERYFGLAVNPVNDKLVLIRSTAITQINPDNGSIVTKYDLLPLGAHYSHVLVDASGTIWAFTGDSSYITKWTLYTAPVNITVPLIWSGIQWLAYANGYALYRQTSTVSEIRFFDANFQLQSVLPLQGLTNFNLSKMYLDTNAIFLLGFEEHGPRANIYGSDKEAASSNLLIRRLGYDGYPQEAEGPDIAITGISVEVPPVFTELPGPTAWQISAGKYVLTIRNNGNIPVNEVHILASDLGILQYDNTCYLKDKRHYSKHLQQINLAPGEETILTIDSLNIVHAGFEALPWNLCFWTAAPNQQRDIDYSNDYTCVTFYDAVSTGEPVQRTKGLGVIPNPATASIRIVLSTAAENPDTYHIFSSSGRLLQQGIIPAGAGEVSAGIEEIPAGVYFVETGGVFGRFVKL